MVNTNFLNELLVVVVLYQKSAYNTAPVQFLANHGSLIPTVYLHDNSERSGDHPTGFIYHHDPSNQGVSRGYNEGLRHALALHKKWILLLDQDTQIDGKYFDVLSAAVIRHPDSQLFAPVLCDRRGMVSPFRWTGTSGKRISRIGSSLDLRRFRFQNSGLLVRTSAFQQVGGYDEKINLDFSDIAFADKMLQITTHFVVVNHTLSHGFSETEHISPEAARRRYQKFCEGARAMGHTLGKRWLFRGRAFLRCLKLTLRYRQFGFVKIFLAS